MKRNQSLVAIKDKKKKTEKRDNGSEIENKK